MNITKLLLPLLKDLCFPSLYTIVSLCPSGLLRLVCCRNQILQHRMKGMLNSCWYHETSLLAPLSVSDCEEITMSKKKRNVCLILSTKINQEV
jgi:uncharacterized protein YfaA (DUF2138 family)